MALVRRMECNPKFRGREWRLDLLAGSLPSVMPGTIRHVAVMDRFRNDGSFEELECSSGIHLSDLFLFPTP